MLENAGYPLKTTLDKGLPLHRVREIQIALEWLMLKEKENHRASDLQTGLSEIRDERESNIWWQLIDMFFEAYREETADSMLPVSWVIDRLYEFVAEQRREKVVGQGIFMSTIHSAKGMEFPHVFILDGDWSQSMGKGQMGGRTAGHVRRHDAGRGNPSPVENLWEDKSVSERNQR